MHKTHVMTNCANANTHAHVIGPIAGWFNTSVYEVRIGAQSKTEEKDGHRNNEPFLAGERVLNFSECHTSV